MAGALLDTHLAPRAEIEFDLIAIVRSELDDRVLRTGGITIVAFEAIAAGQASLGLVQRLRLAQSIDDLIETARTCAQREFVLHRRSGVRIDRQVETGERDSRMLLRMTQITAAKASIDIARGLLAVYG